MAEKRIQRRLAAVLAADVVGYSRQMEADEAGTLDRLKALRSELLVPRTTEFGGRIFKLIGDGILAEFGSAANAVNCAVAIQQTLVDRNSGLPDNQHIELRIGISLGDVLVDGDDLYGNGVNVAARMEGLADPGGICISANVHEHVRGLANLVFSDLGERSVKNINGLIKVFAVYSKNSLSSLVPAKQLAAAKNETQVPEQVVQFCTATDGARIALAAVGKGPPLVKSPNWMNHLEFDWESLVWRHLLTDLAANYRLVRFDQRGNGLSDWDVPNISFDQMVDDLATVIDAIDLEKFSLLGISQGCAYAIAYAVRNPTRVKRLILYGGFARGLRFRGTDADLNRAALEKQMIQDGWGQNNPAFRQFFTSLFIPAATKEQQNAFNILQKITTSPENAVRLYELIAEIDVTDLLRKVSVPTLVLHCRDDGVVPFDEGRRMAAEIPGARFVQLEGENHLMLDDEPAYPRFLRAVQEFLAE